MKGVIKSSPVSFLNKYRPVLSVIFRVEAFFPCFLKRNPESNVIINPFCPQSPLYIQAVILKIFPWEEASLNTVGLTSLGRVASFFRW